MPDDTGAVASDNVLDIAVAPNGDTYIAGEFSGVGTRSGPGVAFSKSTGAWDEGLAEFAGGRIWDAVPDGSGGFFVGGDFSYVGGLQRFGLAHILADGTSDLSFPATSGTVFGLALDGTTLYVSGQFNSIGGISRPSLAAIDAGTGAVTSWNPSDYPPTPVIQRGPLTVDANYVYSGRSRFDKATAVLDNTWQAEALNTTSVASTAAGVYYGGYFNTAGGLPRNYIAAVDHTTGAVIPGIDPDSSAWVFDLLSKNGRLFVGGGFSTIGGAARNGIARLDPATGQADSWDANFGSGGVEAIADAGTTVFAAGDFTSVAGQQRRYMAELDATSAALTGWNANPSLPGDLDAAAISGGRVFGGGNFNMVGRSSKFKVAKLNPDGSLDPSFSPLVLGSPDVHSLDVSPDGSTLYIGGDFTSVVNTSGGSSITRNNAAAIDLATGDFTGWDPSPDAMVTNIVAESGSVFLEGEFSQIAGVPRTEVAALNPGGTGTAQSWDPGLARSGGAVDVTSIESDGSTVFIGGNFDEVGGQTRGRLVEVDATTAAPTAFDPEPNGSVKSMELFGSSLYIGGGFSSVGGSPRSQLAEIMTAGTGTVTGWDPSVGSLGSGVEDLAVADDGSSVFIGGDFITAGGETRRNLAELDRATGAGTAWNPEIEGFDKVLAVAETGGSVKTGGEFVRVGPVPNAFYAQFTGEAQPPSNSSLPTITGTEEVGQTLQASTGGWGGTPPLDFDFAWSRCDAGGGSCQAIGGADSSSYPLTAADLGATLRVTVTATNDQGSDDATSAATGVIAPAGPGPGPDPACSDGIDNDGDGKIDFPADPGCTSAADESETDAAVGPDDSACIKAKKALKKANKQVKKQSKKVKKAKKQVRKSSGKKRKTANKKLKKQKKKLKKLKKKQKKAQQRKNKACSG
ncbi:MAG: delta-60 repeat domain-containing protein [Solirubrobacterales bacterium]|nr:delta-60 repeat domain-containing protein [Solirubrobacterales bacterium]